MKKSNTPTIFIFEDDPYISATISWKISSLGKLLVATTYLEGQELLNNMSGSAVAIVDLHLGNDHYAGKKLLIHCTQKNIPTIMISSDEDEELIAELYRLGATHFLLKRDYLDLLFHYVQTIIKCNLPYYFENIFTSQFVTKYQKLQRDIKQLWSMPTKGQSIHLSGPTGSGKSLLAELYHREVFNEQPFIHLNCAEIPESLLESELFGHVKGAFSGADKEYKGKILLANNGTLFLDEIGCLSLTLQAKLLKVLESKSYYPIGSNQLQKVQFTLITATWEDLFEKAKNNLFRLDLLQRITHYKLRIPPLNERPEDVELFIAHWMKNYPRRFSLNNEAKSKLMHYDFPGNFRELKAILMQLAQSPLGYVDIATLDQFLAKNTENINLDDVTSLGIKKYLKMIEKKIVLDSYEKHQHQVTPVLKELKLSASSFYRITQTENY